MDPRENEPSSSPSDTAARIPEQARRRDVAAPGVGRDTERHRSSTSSYAAFSELGVDAVPCDDATATVTDGTRFALAQAASSSGSFANRG